MNNIGHINKRKVKVAAALFTLGVSLFAVSSCSNEDYLGGHFTADGQGSQIQITATIVDESGVARSFEENDVIGISTSYAATDATARNRSYKYDGSKLVAVGTYPMYIKGATSVFAYYPFMGTDGSEIVLSISTSDQQNIKPLYIAAAEGLTPNSSNAKLNFKSVYSALQIAIKAPDGETIKSYRLSGLVHSATVNPYTGAWTYSSPSDLTGSGDDIKSLSLILLPQEVNNATLVLVGTTRSYTITLSSLSMKAATSQQATVDVTDGIGTIEFSTSGGQWGNSNLGGEVYSD